MRSRAILYLLTLLVGLVSGENRNNAFCLVKPGDPGHCHSNLTRYSYYPKSNTCKSFKYGGCAGTQNRFMTNEFCELQCVEKS